MTTDVLIIGGGPAGLFAARELTLQGVKNVTIIDSGKDADVRECPLTEACNCTPCDILEGFGGSGGVSDGKMTFALDRGTQLEQIFKPEHAELLGYIDDVMINMGITGVRYEPGSIPDGFAEGVPIEFNTYPLWHIGSDGVQKFSQQLTDEVRDLGVNVATGVRALSLIPAEDGSAVVGARARWNVGRGNFIEEEIRASKVILAVGIFGMGWLEHELTLMGFQFSTGPAGIGLRIEAPEPVLAPVFDAFYDWKAIGEFDGVVFRSFCCNRYGHIMPEYHKHLDIRNVNGHSYLDPSKRSGSSNFSLQAKIPIEFHSDPQSFVRAVARNMNNLSGGWQVRETVKSFLGMVDEPGGDEKFVTYPQARVRSVHSAIPASLLNGFTKYLKALEVITPGLIESGWVYGPEVKYHARKLPVEREDWRLEGMKDTYVVGDSTGLTGSYVSAAMTGIIAARGIAQAAN